MKKFIALAIAVVMLAALAVPAFAAEGNDTTNATGETTVTYGVGNSYVLTVPASITVGTALETDKVAVSSYNVVAAKKVQVEASSTDGFVLTTTDGEGTFEYELNNTIFTFTGNDEQAVTAAWAEDVTAPSKAGTYKDTVTFTATIINA